MIDKTFGYLIMIFVAFILELRVVRSIEMKNCNS
jgi:hypothetical protein